jgi:hypothetical protein
VVSVVDVTVSVLTGLSAIALPTAPVRFPMVSLVLKVLKSRSPEASMATAAASAIWFELRTMT